MHNALEAVSDARNKHQNGVHLVKRILPRVGATLYLKHDTVSYATKRQFPQATPVKIVRTTNIDAQFGYIIVSIDGSISELLNVDNLNVEPCTCPDGIHTEDGEPCTLPDDIVDELGEDEDRLNLWTEAENRESYGK